ncbi:helix-turn-helix transcriptional regulator [archaeon]|jgi:DNA-binding HxlR family transcriptional regulator|nr:helix-turn-helix transcriptional regulator [archaeon]
MAKKCPIDNTLQYIGKKWSIPILRDLFTGKTRFHQFLEANSNLSTKMLSTRLKELESNAVIEKRITNKHPVTIEYHLTPKGKGLGKILYELCMFSINEFSDDVCGGVSKKQMALKVKKQFGIK